MLTNIKEFIFESNYNQIANSTKFNKWFKDSKTTIGHRPMIFYHGSNSIFDKFDNKYLGLNDAGWMGSGFYFTIDKYEASNYGKYVSSYFLNIKNIYYISDDENEMLADENDKYFSKDFSEIIQSKGYDGICHQKRGEYLVFNPNQIWLLESNI